MCCIIFARNSVISRKPLAIKQYILFNWAPSKSLPHALNPISVQFTAMGASRREES
jgi:hypothetical protein